MALPATQALAWPVSNPGDSESPDGRIQTSRDFKRLQSRAATSADFTALAEYCQSRVSHYQQDKAENEAELQHYNSKAHTNNPKFQPLDETLRRYIAHDEKEIVHWSDLASQYSAQAGKLEEVKPQR